MQLKALHLLLGKHALTDHTLFMMKIQFGSEGDELTVSFAIRDKNLTEMTFLAMLLRHSVY